MIIRDRFIMRGHPLSIVRGAFRSHHHCLEQSRRWEEIRRIISAFLRRLKKMLELLFLGNRLPAAPLEKNTLLFVAI